MSASEDAPPRLKIFLSPIDSYLGRALFRFFKSQKHDIYASCLYGEDDPRYFRPNYVRSFVSLENREELKATLLQCDVIIYDIAQKYEEANFAIEEVSTIRLHDEKTFIALSSILTWARTEKNEPEEGEEGETLPAPPFTEEDRRKRRPHPTYRNVLQLERLILRRARRRLRTLVLTLGVLYGDGEEPFHDWFKMAWHGEPAALPLYGDGENHVPTIHVRDVCTIVGHVIEQPPEETILLCVDEGNATQRQIAEAIANKMGTGRVEPVSEEQLMLTSRDLAYLIEDVPMESAVLREMELEWHCQGGLIEHLDKVVEEYKQDRGLTALKILVHGPPASGKTTLSQALAQHFKLAHVNLDATIEEYRNMPAPERPQRSGEEEEEEEELERSPEEIRAEQLHYFHNEVECEERRRIHWVEFAVPGGFPLMDICRPPPLEKAPPKPKRDEHEENAEGASNAGERADAESSAMPAMPPPVVLPDGLSGASPTASRTEAASTSPQAPQAESAPETETLLPPRIAATIRANPPPRPPGMLLSSLRKAQPAQTQPQQSAQQPSGDTAAAAAPPQEGVPAPAPAAPKPTLPSLAHQESGDDIEEWKLAHEGETIRIRCSLFICCAARDVGTFLFYALNEGSIVYDGRLVVDANYTTNDPLILSSGTLAKFSRQLVLDSQGQAPPSFDRYNGRESGTALGKYIVEHIEEVLSRTVLPDMAPPDGPPMYIPRFEAPIVESCWLPGGLAYFYARLPPPPPFLLSPTPQGRVLVSDTGAHRVRMTVDSQQRIASFSYAGTELVEFSNLKNIVGMPQTLVNRVCQRYDDEIVPDLISLLREPWATALYQDRFASFQDSLLREVQRALDPILAGMQGGEPLDAAESHFRAADFASVLDPLHRWARDQIDLAVAADQTPPTGAGATPSEPRLSSPMSGRAPRPQGGKNLLLPALPAATQASLLRKLTPAARKQVAIRVVQYLRRNQDHLPMYLVRNEAGEGLDDAALRHE
eukprot:gnl/Trimastix_PCT/825.p1 GENE.gnl/Trimastix_PCT/825~~gnl/Trimastix_PCT/825.p1  ORF type:complete len:1009 (+),score=386.96 gnl/Trimastix_PCT/825:46-3027(+)